MEQFTDLDLLVQWHQAEFSDLPLEALFKQDMLRMGIAFDLKSLKEGGYKTKDYFIFSFDRVSLESMSEKDYLKAPEEIRFSGGELGLRQTVVSVRINPESPYKVALNETGELAISFHSRFFALVDLPPIPDYYNLSYNIEKPPGEIAPVIEWGYLIYLTVFRNCQYFGKEEECAFCDINHNWRQQKKTGRPYTGVKPVEMILEVLSGIDKTDRVAEVYTLTGGSVVTSLQGKNELEFYSRYAEAINTRFPGRWTSKVVTQAYEKDELKILKDAGVEIYHPNYEVWDSKIFSSYCPGKERYIGRDRWIKRIIESAEVFGAQNVIPNFVAGIELAGDEKMGSVDQAVASTIEGVNYFMDHGIVPRFTTWCPEPYTVLGEEPPAPLEYYMKLLREYRNSWKARELPVPPGYGKAGAGNAVFSVSAFMDVLE